MDVYNANNGLKKDMAEARQPLRPAAKNNAVTAGCPGTKKISSRYRSPSPSVTRRCPSPNITRTISSSSQLVPRRAISAERKHPSTSPSLIIPSTPAQASSTDMPLSSKRLSAVHLPESLWPSTMRSVGDSFQSDRVAVPVRKKEKPVNSPLGDRTLRPSSNAAHRQAESMSFSRRPTPERKRSPLKDNFATDHLENLKPFASSRSWAVDQHRWSGRTSRKITSNALNESLDLSDKPARGPSSSTMPSSTMPGTVRRFSLSDGMGKHSQRSSSETARLLSHNETGGSGSVAKSVDATLTRSWGSQRRSSSSYSDSTTAAAGLHIFLAPKSRPASPRRNSLSSLSNIARGVSPSRARPLTPPSKGVSPPRIRQTSTSTQSSSTTSVLSFIADFKKGKKGASHLEDAHQLRLVYNRFVQWRFANARAEAVMYLQRITAEETLYNVCEATLDLLDLVTRKWIIFKQLKLGMKLNSIMNDQMRLLDDWAVLEQDYIGSLAGFAEDLQASTQRLPVTDGARAEEESLKAEISSALDVMQSMGSFLCSSLSKVEEMSSLVSELAAVASEEKFMLEKCKVLLASTEAVQIKGWSLKTHMIQMNLEEASEPPRIFSDNISRWP